MLFGYNLSKSKISIKIGLKLFLNKKMYFSFMKLYVNIENTIKDRYFFLYKNVTKLYSFFRYYINISGQL